MKIELHTNIQAFTRDMDRLKKQQVPYATALALNDVAAKVADAETRAIDSTFASPTPFTMRALGVKPARKFDLTATVFVKDIQAAYLAPFEFGGTQVLGSKRAILTPRDMALNQYGNIPRGKLASLKGRPDVFIGEVRTRDGKTISGVWQRPTVSPAGRRIKGLRNANRTGRLKLLIQFTNPAEVTHPLGYRDRARSIVETALPKAFGAAMARALATAR